MKNNSKSAKSFRDVEHTGWEEKAGDYDAYIGKITAPSAKCILDAAEINHSSHLLDVATGTGGVAGYAANLGADVMGVDFSLAMISEAKKKYASVKFLCGDAEALAFEDKTFDAVSCAFGLLHFENPERAMAESYRVLRPGGHYVFTNWASSEEHEFFKIVLNAIADHGNQKLDVPEAPPIFRFSEEQECREVLGSLGFVDIEVRTLPLVWALDRPEELIELIYKSTVRTDMILQAQTPQASKSIVDAILDETRHYRQGTGFQFSWPAFMVKASKPLFV